ncbi:hypothetical protein [Adlercreutzia murintestinalis]|uniref:hypothetical protein n=1 Tax=Adlercreutzia murintestinalis TaxID=2941325 RepID=UPI00203D3D25|nr:hypothetical protein [Adlercreutzia murintestinalis]
MILYSFLDAEINDGAYEQLNVSPHAIFKLTLVKGTLESAMQRDEAAFYAIMNISNLLFDETAVMNKMSASLDQYFEKVKKK